MKSILLIIFIITTALSAQNFELFSLNSVYYPKSKVEGKPKDIEIGFAEFSGHVSLPQVFQEGKTVLIHTLMYGQVIADTEFISDGDAIDKETYLYKITYGQNWVRNLNKRWKLSLNFMPTLTSDFRDGLVSDDFLLQAAAMGIYKKSDNLTFGFGAAFTSRLGRELVVPTGILLYKYKKMNLDIILPNGISVMFDNNSKNLKYGVIARMDGGLFNIRDGEIDGSMMDEAGYSRIKIGPALYYKLKGALFLKVLSGVTVGRKFEFIDTKDKLILDMKPDEGPFIQVGLSFIPQMK